MWSETVYRGMLHTLSPIDRYQQDPCPLWGVALCLTLVFVVICLCVCNRFLKDRRRFALMWWPTYAGVVVVVVVVVRTKWGSRISREWFDLKSPTFARTSTAAYSAATLEITWPTTSGRELSRKKYVENAVSDGFQSNFSGAAFCLPH